jgi:cellulose synthase/poly-beta-1,6-N-acetylglucosamine synthase-like glycosyltransferase
MVENSKNQSLPKKVFGLLKRIIRYFPARFILFGFFFAYIFLSNFQFQVIENQILVSFFQFFQIPAYIDNDIFVGSPYNSVEFAPPTHTQILFLIFFPSLAISTRATLEARAKILLFGMLCFLTFTVTQFLTIASLLTLGFASQMAFMQASIIVTGIVASVVVEITLFSILKLPKRTKVSVIIKRSYVDEYVYLALTLIGSILLVYFVTTIFKLQIDSPVTAYLALSIFTILSFRYFISYFIYEIKTPHWSKEPLFRVNTQNGAMPVSFLLPAYNEEKHIKRSIESIDKAASRYPGKTEIIVVNDGSTDDTRRIASEAILNLKHANGKVFNIPNSGKGFALQYGLKRTTGDVVFRIDSDSAIDERAISPIMNHFKDPRVGSVSGLILPLEEKSWLQKVWILQFYLLAFYRREWELIDSVLSQPGAFSIFRKDALIRVGGWVDHQLGEDGEITVRLGRCGYRNEYEQHALAFSDVPANLKDLREQRVRWSIAFYHARAANLNVIKEFKGPLSLMYVLALLREGSQFTGALFLPFLLAEAVVGHEFSIYNLASLLGISLGLITIELLTYGLQGIVNLYFLLKFKKYYLIKYLPLLRIYDLIHSMFIEPEAVEILLSVSSRWKEHTKELSAALRKKVREGI